MKSSPTGAVLQLLLVIPSLASASHFRRVAVLRGGADGGGSSGGLDIDSMLELAKSPEAAEELRRLTADPEAMREARELMDDPDFRRQVTEALAAGGGAKFEQIRETLSAESDLTSHLHSMRPSLGAAIDVLRQKVELGDELDLALSTLEGLARKLAEAHRDAKYRRIRLSNEALQGRLLRHGGGQRALEALGFRHEVEIEGEPHLEHDGEGLPTGAPGTEREGGDDARVPGELGRCLEMLADARRDCAQALAIAKQHTLPYVLTRELPSVRRTLAGDDERAQLLTHLMLENAEFRAHVNGVAAAAALPSILMLLSTREGVQGLIEYYTGTLPADSRVVRVATVSEWKQALSDAGERPVVALFASASDMGSRLLAPIFARLSAPPEDDSQPTEDSAMLDGVDFIHVVHDPSVDDGLAAQVFDEVGLGLGECPSVLFLVECLELRKWRYRGVDVKEIVKRLKRVVANDRLDDGPDADEEAE